MEKIGVGDCQSHVAHWLENRIRNLRREVQAQGGSIASQDIEARLCEHVRSGLVEGLSYDEASGRVYLASPSPPPNQSFPRVPAPMREARQYIYPYRTAPVIGWQMPLGPRVQFSRFPQAGRPEGVSEFAKRTGYPTGAGYGPGVTTTYPHCSPHGIAASTAFATPAVGEGVGAAGLMHNPTADLRGGVDTSTGLVEQPQVLGHPHEVGYGQSIVDGLVPDGAPLSQPDSKDVDKGFKDDITAPTVSSQRVGQTGCMSGGKTHLTDGTAPSTSEQPAKRDRSAHSSGDSSASFKNQGVLKILKRENTPGDDEPPFDAERGDRENRVHPEQCRSKQRPEEFLLPSQKRLGQPEQMTDKTSVGRLDSPSAPPPLHLSPPQTLPPVLPPQDASQAADAPSTSLQGNEQRNASAVAGLGNLSPRSDMHQATKAAVHGHAAREPSLAPPVLFETVRGTNSADPTVAALTVTSAAVTSSIAPAPSPMLLARSKSPDTAAGAIKVADDFLPTGRVLSASNAAADQSSKDASTDAAVSSGMPQAGVTLTSDTVNTALNLGCTGSEVTPSPSAIRTVAEFLVIHDGPSMTEAAAALGVTVGEQDDAGHFSRAFGGAEPVAVRLDERSIGGENNVVSTVQIAGNFPRVLIFDVQSLLRAPGGPAILDTELRSLLVDKRILKVMHDVHDHAVALARLIRAPCFRIKSVVDMQVVHEELTGHPLNSFTECLSCFGLCGDPSLTLSMDGGASVKRPLSSSTFQLAADGVVRLRKAFLLAQGTMAKEDQLAICFRASQMRADFAVDTRRSGWRRMVFASENVRNERTLGRDLASYELFVAPKLSRRPNQDTQQGAQTLLAPLASPTRSENPRHEIGVSTSDQGSSDPGGKRGSFQDSRGLANNDVLEMLKYLPKVFAEGLLSGRSNDIISGLEEVVLDQGTRPRALVQGRGKVYLCDDEDVLVTRYHISCVVGRLEYEGLLAADDRTGFDGLLHRVGVIRDKNGIIYGVTIRVRRFVKGCAEVFGDILLDADPGNRRCRAPSILVLGGHNSGKTTLVRDMCRKLSATENVVVVDTRNDIGGEGVVPHREAIGESRRIMVRCETMQHRVMHQALRNHGPRTLAVDEISSQEDVEACRILKARGVRIIAGAVGDLPSTLDSPLLGAALGGLVPVESPGRGDDQKQERRAGKPVFDVVIELEGGNQPTWSVVTRVATVVDELLEKGCVCKSEIRAPLPAAELMHDEDPSKGNTCTGFLLKVTQESSDVWRW